LITDELLAEIAAAHRTGRRLYVGTTNLDTKRQVVWDLGAIAAGNDPKRLDLFRKILLASAAIPALLPTVPIDIFVNGRRHTELHIDGGAAASLFLHRDMLQPDRATEPVTEQNVFVIVAKGLQQPNEPVERTLSRVAGESLSGVLHAQMEGDLRKVFSLARDSGARVHLAAIPSGFEKNSDSMAFDRKLMRQLFDEGFHSAATGECWQSRLPVDIEQEASPRPRRGVQFQLRESPPVDLKRGKG
jgi:predicted acylesterase/phospholipase RssA